MTILQEYADKLASDFRVKPIGLFAKILTPNDDSGRHGVLVPREAYDFFPDLPIANPAENATVLIRGVDVLSKKERPLGWKYYERYPERRITRLNSAFSEMNQGRRLALMVRADASDGAVVYLTEVLIEHMHEDFGRFLNAIFGDAPRSAGAFAQTAFDKSEFRIDRNLSDLLKLYDAVHARGWIDTLRHGDTGIGYTFESLLGIKENNDQNADFRGIEIKCKLKREKSRTSGKINLFQMGPSWSNESKMIDRLKAIGTLNESGLYACYSQVQTVANNLGLKLCLQAQPSDIDLTKNDEKIGWWDRANLARRLEMKHSRAVFVTAEARPGNGTIQYHYKDLVYCESPDIDRFMDMVDNRRIVFEFAMHEKPSGRVRNHGYPWRLVDEKELDTLFGFKIRLRGQGRSE